VNRVRDCLTQNKQELVATLRTPRVLSRRVKTKLDGLLEKIIVSAPLDRPANSWMLDGQWTRVGSFANEVNTVSGAETRAASMVATRSFFGGLISVKRSTRLTEVDDYCFDARDGVLRLELFRGIIGFNFPSWLKSFNHPRLTIHFLDENLLITSKSRTPEVFVKVDKFSEQREMLSTSPDRLRIIQAYFEDALIEMTAIMSPSSHRFCMPRFFSKKAASVDLSNKGPGIIGDVNWDDGESAPWATEEDMLEKLRVESEGMSSSFVVGDLLAGKLRGPSNLASFDRSGVSVSGSSIVQ
jgi:hypothetical protein